MLRPKIVVAENVKGLITGNARGYVKQIFEKFKRSGYDCQLFLLDASRMGVPQKRQRVFFVASRSDLNFPKLKLSFKDPIIPVSSITETGALHGTALTKREGEIWDWCNANKETCGGKANLAMHGKRTGFDTIKLDPNKPSCTISTHNHTLHWRERRRISDHEAIRISTFPIDYNFGKVRAKYVLGMSVPPVMMKRLAAEINKQWLV